MNLEKGLISTLDAHLTIIITSLAIRARRFISTNIRNLCL